MKKEIRIAIFVIAIILIGYFSFSKLYYERQLYKKNINSKILKVEFRNRGGYIYSYDNSFFYASTFLDRESMLLDENILKEGDSLVKEPNSLVLKIYRKDQDGHYKIFNEWSGR